MHLKLYVNVSCMGEYIMILLCLYKYILHWGCLYEEGWTRYVVYSRKKHSTIILLDRNRTKQTFNDLQLVVHIY